MDESDTQTDSSLLALAAVAVAAELRAVRARRGLTRAELAELAGMHVNTVYRLETNQRAMSVPQLFALAKALKISPGDFLNAAQSAME